MEPRILIAGVGNIFFADDGFGVAVARQLGTRDWPAGVRVVDFGIRGRDLAFALLDNLDFAILIDALQRGHSPGHVSVIEPQLDAPELANHRQAFDGHRLDIPGVLQSAAAQARERFPRVLLVGCEPGNVDFLENESHSTDWISLSAPVQSAVDEACQLIEKLVESMANPTRVDRYSPTIDSRIGSE